MEEVDDSGAPLTLYECIDPCRVMKVTPVNAPMRKEAIVEGSIIEHAFADAFNGFLEEALAKKRYTNTASVGASSDSGSAQTGVRSDKLTSASGGIPTRIGQCARTAVDSVSTRLSTANGETVPGSGSAITLTNGVFGVSYEQIASVDRSRRGDEVRTCLIQIPRDCPAGDERGRVYKTTNLRTGETWTLPDASHMCGGA